MKNWDNFSPCVTNQHDIIKPFRIRRVTLFLFYSVEKNGTNEKGITYSILYALNIDIDRIN